MTTCCIPARNCASTLERAVDSAYRAGCTQVVIANDGSTDDTQGVIESIYHEHDHDGNFEIVVFNSWGVRQGASVTRNHMINCPLCHDLVICLDADDTLNDIAPLVAAWQPQTWVYGDYNIHNGDSVQHVKGCPVGSLARKELTGVTFLFHKDDWKLCGGFSPDYAYAEDYALQCNLVHHGVKPVYVEHTVYERYMHPEGNPRTAYAREFWNFYHQMCRRDYPSVFAGTG